MTGGGGVGFPLPPAAAHTVLAKGDDKAENDAAETNLRREGLLTLIRIDPGWKNDEHSQSSERCPRLGLKGLKLVNNHTVERIPSLKTALTRVHRLRQPSATDASPGPSFPRGGDTRFGASGRRTHRQSRGADRSRNGGRKADFLLTALTYRSPFDLGT